MRDILQTPLSTTEGSDKLLWSYTNYGDYTIRSGYHMAEEDGTQTTKGPSTSVTMPKEFLNSIWKADAPRKVKMFMWKACHNSLALKEKCSREDLCRARNASYVPKPQNPQNMRSSIAPGPYLFGLGLNFNGILEYGRQ